MDIVSVRYFDHRYFVVFLLGHFSTGYFVLSYFVTIQSSDFNVRSYYYFLNSIIKYTVKSTLVSGTLF